MKRYWFVALLSVCWSLPTAGRVAGQVPAAPAVPLTSNDPAVQALLDSDPSTPADLLRVTGLLLDLREPKFAKVMMQRLAATTPGDAELALLARRVGTTTISRLASEPVLQPEGKEFATRVYAAMRNAARDPARIAELIGRLADPTLSVQAAAIAELRLGGDVAVQALVDTLLAAPDAGARRMPAIALAGMGDAAVGPASALIESGNDALVASGVMILALMEEQAALPELYAAGFAPKMPPAAAEAARGALQKRLGKPTTPLAAAGRLLVDAEALYERRTLPSVEPTSLWQWDAASGRPAVEEVPERAAELLRAARYARTAAEIAGGDVHAQRVSRGAAFEALFWQAADPSALDQAIAAWTAREQPSLSDLEAMYRQALQNDRLLAAARLLKLSAAAAPPETLLVGVGGRPTTLVAAATHPDATIRFAAVETIMSLQPQQPFVGSSGVAESLAWFASGTGVDRAVVADPLAGRGRDHAALLVEAGVRAEAVDDAQAAPSVAAAQSDVQLIIVDQRFIEPAHGNLLARLRADYRTARTPVIVFADPESVNRLRDRYLNDHYTLVLYRPTTAEHLTTQLKLNPLPGAERQVPGPERLRRAEFALGAMRELLATKNPVFNLRPYEGVLLAAAVPPSPAKAGLAALAQFGSAAAQRTLADVASAHALPLDLRQAAATGFCEHVIQFGTLLTTSEIVRQYDRYNDSETRDAPTQQLLAMMLDVIEAKAGKIPLAKTSPPAAAAPSVPAAPLPAEPVPAAPAAP